jgi:hypothetical protein
MKTYIVAVYAEVDTAIVLETRIQQTHGLIGSPVGHQVLLGINQRQ